MTASTMIFGALLTMSGLAQPAQDAPASASPAAEQGAPQPTSAPEKAKTFDLARLKMDQCPGERFDFLAGEQTKVGLCSQAGASKDEIAAMLESAIKRLETMERMPPDTRDQVVAQIRAKLAEVKAR